MCNIAAYVGSRPAAPILIDLIRKQEGLNGGFYIGLATVSGGKIHYRKVVGSLEDLLSQTDALHLPGTVGIIHTRTPGGGDAEWGHPFLGEKNGQPVIAMVLNGSRGYFSDLALNIPTAETLIGEGYTFRTRTAGAVHKEFAPLLSDGTCVHTSEIVCNLILRNLDRGLAPASAMARTMQEFPAECVQLLLTEDRDDRIAYSRFNMPMHLGFADHGCYMASAPMCFPEDAGEPLPVPAGSSGYVYGDHYESYPYKTLPSSLASITARVRKDGYDTVCRELAEWKTVPDLAKAVASVFDPAACVQKAMLVYDILYSLQKEGCLEIKTEQVPGVTSGLTAPEFHMKLK